MELVREYVDDIRPQFKRGIWIVVGLLLILTLRLYQLQIAKGKYYRSFSEQNSVKVTHLPALRGLILDRNGVILAKNRPRLDLVLIPQYVVDADRVLETVSKKFQFSTEGLVKLWDRRKLQPAYRPISLVSDIPLDSASWIKARKTPWEPLTADWDLRGLDIEARYERDYLAGDSSSHLLGYLREIDSRRLSEYQTKWKERYQKRDVVGVRGVEEIWDPWLRGYDGEVQKVVNAVGQEIRDPQIEKDLSRVSPRPGKHVKLTVDARLQQRASELFKGKSGAAVAIDPSDGGVLLLFSAPTFDLAKLTGSGASHYWEEIVENPKEILFNRAIQGSYPPGSIYKVVVATAALQEKLITPQETIYCPGHLTFGNRSFLCWREGGHGMVSLHRGLVESCDVYFYHLGMRLGPDTLARYAHLFGLGAKSGIELKEEKGGFIPTTSWKERVGDPKTMRQAWWPGETLSIAIGQGYNQVTPLQAAFMIATVANGGQGGRPHLLLALVDPETGEEQKISPHAAPTTTLSPFALALVRSGLIGVVAEEGGTAHRLATLGIPIAGKTGTAQVVARGKACKGSQCEDHAWFVAFAPVENPRIALAVIVEHGGHGSSAAAPIAGELIREYLSYAQ